MSAQATQTIWTLGSPSPSTASSPQFEQTTDWADGRRLRAVRTKSSARRRLLIRSPKKQHRRRIPLEPGGARGGCGRECWKLGQAALERHFEFPSRLVLNPPLPGLVG